jgi:hypothetical protein
MTTPQPTQPKLRSVYRGQVCVGFLMARRNGAVEVFDADQHSLGQFTDPHAAAAVIYSQETT